VKSKWPGAGARHAGGEHSLATAISLHRSGQFVKARRIYQDILTTNPDHVDALHFLGVLYHQTGQSDRAVASIERALTLAPGYADAWNNLGNVLRESNQLDAALRAYHRVVELVPGHADALNNLGVVLRGRGLYEEAESAYARALESNPAHIAAWQNRGIVLARMNRPDDAVAAFKRVLELKPGDSIANAEMGRVLYRNGRIAEAIVMYREWLQSDPGNSIAQHMLAAFTGDAAPPRASDNYVRATFDSFAGSFDEVLDQLGYRAPGLIGELLDRDLPAADGSLMIADAGCGTGLCGEFLRPRAKRLVGIDLSPGMLARARTRGTYDDLVEAELSAWLGRQRHAYDVIVSADTLCYFGVLDAVVAAAANALTPGGLFVFTVERAAEDVRAFKLDASGRYSHAGEYVRASVADAKLAVKAIDPVVLRRERGQDVAGWLVSARRHPSLDPLDAARAGRA
jgi:predicted TPR repeat methyltransferase